jgi:hypothetical protein
LKRVMPETTFGTPLRSNVVGETAVIEPVAVERVIGEGPVTRERELIELP